MASVFSEERSESDMVYLSMISMGRIAIKESSKVFFNLLNYYEKNNFI
jgi:hypothetical protein